MVLKFAFGTVSVLVNLFATYVYGVHVGGNGLVLYGCTKGTCFVLGLPLFTEINIIPYLSTKWLIVIFLVIFCYFMEQ